MPRTAIALGSNLGRRLDNLQQARNLLRTLASPDGPFLQAPVFETTPVGCPDESPDFYNTVVAFEFDGTPEELLARTRAVEQQLGRIPHATRNAPRVIDVDILYLGSESVDTADLVLPHPRLTSRRFVLEPLAAIEPDFVLPGTTTTIAGHLLRLTRTEPPLTLVQSAW